MSGVIDAPHKSMSSTVSDKIPEIGSLSMTFLVIEAEKHYAKIGFKPASVGKRLGVPAGWLTVDPAKIDDLGDSPYSYDGETDPLGARQLLGTSTDIERTGDGAFTGTADLSDIAASHPVLDEEEIASLGAKAKKVPFSATVDTATGKLAKVTVTMPSGGKVKGGTCTLAYSGYGSTEAPAAPTEPRKANATVYSMLNG
ncbi:hypothetical protein [Actinoplanes sp. DH11]|uniref:hypothetical protein n=1 Tax=Actinoplanes sp. DH11 TaxID=2857011 RepID=UPI001E40EE12|nr:hypothetical protein [Actinoplanes sp. DH11]